MVLDIEMSELQEAKLNALSKARGVQPEALANAALRDLIQEHEREFDRILWEVPVRGGLTERIRRHFHHAVLALLVDGVAFFYGAVALLALVPVLKAGGVLSARFEFADLQFAVWAFTLGKLFAGGWIRIATKPTGGKTMGARVTWRMDDHHRPKDSLEWERTINEWYGNRSGQVDMNMTERGKRWRVDSAFVEGGGPYKKGDRFPSRLDVRIEVTQALQGKGCAVDD